MRVVHFQATPHTSSKIDTGDGSELGLVSFPDPPPPLCSHFEVGAEEGSGGTISIPVLGIRRGQSDCRTQL